jgi:hypothetical protein
MKKKENIEMKEHTEEDKSDKIKEEEGEESVGRRHWSQFNYRSTTFSWLISFKF